MPTLDGTAAEDKAMANFTDMLKAMEVMRRVDDLLAAVAWDDTKAAAEPAYNLGRVLDVANVKVIDSGHFGCAINCGSVVLKLGVSAEDGYPLYVKWAQDNPGRGVVRIHGHGKTERLSWALLPVLRPLTEEDKLRTRSLGGNPQSYLGKAYATIRNELGEYARWDCHDDNIMYDPELGEYVITDPLAHCTRSRELIEAQLSGSHLIREHVARDLWSMSQPVAEPPSHCIADDSIDTYDRLSIRARSIWTAFL